MDRYLPFLQLYSALLPLSCEKIQKACTLLIFETTKQHLNHRQLPCLALVCCRCYSFFSCISCVLVRHSPALKDDGGSWLNFRQTSFGSSFSKSGCSLPLAQFHSPCKSKGPHQSLQIVCRTDRATNLNTILRAPPQTWIKFQ